MKKRCMFIVSLMLIMSLLCTGLAFAEEGGQDQTGSQNTSEVQYSGDQTTTGEVYGEPSEDSEVVTDQPLSEVEITDPAGDIAPDEVGLEGPPEPLEGSWEDVTELAEQVDQELAGAAPAIKLHALVKAFKNQNGWDAPHLMAVSAKINLATKNHLRYIKNHPQAEHAIIRMTDETVRLAHRFVNNDRAKAAVYKNAAQTYSLLGAYKRAAGVTEMLLKLSPDRAAAYKNLTKLYGKAGQKGLKVFVKGQRPNFDVQPVVKNGRTMVPIRAISETMGAKVNYDARNQKVNIVNGDININLQVNKNSAVVNGRNVNLDAPVTVVNGRTMVPLRFVSENLGAKVNYDSQSETVTVE